MGFKNKVEDLKIFRPSAKRRVKRWALAARFKNGNQIRRR
jgi:hypothetical protein